VGSRSLVFRLGVPSQLVGLPAPIPPQLPASWTGARDLQATPPPQVAPGGRRKRGDTGCVVPTGRLFRTPAVGPRRLALRSARGLPVGPRRPAPRPRARRGTLVLRHHHHQVHRHRNRHHHRARRHHPRGSSSNNNNSSRSRSDGRPTFRVAGSPGPQVSVVLLPLF
jgi:hypothetical protein